MAAEIAWVCVTASAGVLVCVSGVALVVLAKNGLGDPAGATALGCFAAAAVGARLAAGHAGTPTRHGRRDGSVGVVR